MPLLSDACADAVAAPFELVDESAAKNDADISTLSYTGAKFAAVDRSKAGAGAFSLGIDSDRTLDIETLPAGADSVPDADADLASAASTNANASSPFAAADAALSLLLIPGELRSAAWGFPLLSLSFLVLLAFSPFATALPSSSSDDDDDDGLPKPTPTRLMLLVAFCLDFDLDMIVDLSAILFGFVWSALLSSSLSPWDHSTGENDGIGGFPLLLLVPIAFLFLRLVVCLLLPLVLPLAVDCKLPADSMLS